MFFSSLMGIAVVREFCAIIIATKAEGVLQENEGSKTRKDYVYVSLYVAFLTPSFLKGKKQFWLGGVVCGVISDHCQQNQKFINLIFKKYNASRGNEASDYATCGKNKPCTGRSRWRGRLGRVDD